MPIDLERIFVHIPYRTLLSNLDKVNSLGINVEIYVDGDVLDSYTREDIDLINSFFAKHGLKKILHGPLYDLNPGSLDSRIREVSCRRLREAVSFCEKLKSNHLVFHHGFNHIYYKNQRQKWLENSCLSWQPIVENALEKGIKLAIENSLDPEPSIVLELINRIDSPNFRACFDLGHFNAFGEKPALEIFNLYPAEDISEVHLSDNLGDFDAHLALGKGRIDFKGFFRLLDSKGIEPIITIEPHSLEDVQPSKEYLLKISNQ